MRRRTQPLTALEFGEAFYRLAVFHRFGAGLYFESAASGLWRRQETIVQRAIQVLCGLFLSLSVVSLGGTIMFLNEATDDGWQITEYTNLALYLRQIAPFGGFPFLTGALVGFCFFATTRDTTLRFVDLMIASLVFIISITLFAAVSQVVRDQLYLDGWLEGTALAWIFHSAIAAGLMIVGIRSLKQESPNKP